MAVCDAAACGNVSVTQSWRCPLAPAEGLENDTQRCSSLKFGGLSPLGLKQHRVPAGLWVPLWTGLCKVGCKLYFLLIFGLSLSDLSFFSRDLNSFSKLILPPLHIPDTDLWLFAETEITMRKTMLCI